MITRLMTIALALTVPAAARAQDAAAPSAKNDAAVDPAALAAAKHLIATMKLDATPDRMFVGLSPLFAEGVIGRPEKQTSELQSLIPNSYAVFRLKKKQRRQ